MENPRGSFARSVLPSVSFYSMSLLFSCLVKHKIAIPYPRSATIDQRAVPEVSLETALLRLNSKRGSDVSPFQHCVLLILIEIRGCGLSRNVCSGFGSRWWTECGVDWKR